MRNKSKAIIFDMNGVIIFDERYHQKSWIELFNRYNLSFTEDKYKVEVFGRTEYDIIKFAFGKNLTQDQINKYCDERDQIVRELIENNLPVADGIVDLIKELSIKSIPFGIATSSRRGYVNFVLDTLDIKKYFHSITTAEEITHGKPDPEIYMKAANKLNISPKDCTAIEDSISGIKSAQGAGMYCVGITSTHALSDISFADKIINSFVGIKLTDLNLL